MIIRFPPTSENALCLSVPGDPVDLHDLVKFGRLGLADSQIAHITQGLPLNFFQTLLADEVRGLPGLLLGKSELLLAQGDALHEEGHVPGQGAHGLQAAFSRCFSSLVFLRTS
jgi:hypothetical protein